MLQTDWGHFEMECWGPLQQKKGLTFIKVLDKKGTWSQSYRLNSYFVIGGKKSTSLKVSKSFQFLSQQSDQTLKIAITK